MRIAVLGLGLIGGSLLRALTAAGHDVSGYDVDGDVRDLARKVSAQMPPRSRAGTPPHTADTKIATSVSAALDGTALAFIAVPLPALPGLLDEFDGYSGVISDVISVKGPVATLTAGRRHVGGHPMAGSEHSGFGASDPDLFHDQPWVLCLDPETDLDDWTLVARVLTGIGARVIPATSTWHDAAVARISHVPHLVAAAIAASAADPGVRALAAGSFRDGTRVAASAPALVAAMCGGNAPAVRDALDELIADLVEARSVLDDPQELRGWLERGHAVRKDWPVSLAAVPAIPSDRANLLKWGRRGHPVSE